MSKIARFNLAPFFVFSVSAFIFRVLVSSCNGPPPERRIRSHCKDGRGEERESSRRRAEVQMVNSLLSLVFACASMLTATTAFCHGLSLSHSADAPQTAPLGSPARRQHKHSRVHAI